MTKEIEGTVQEILDRQTDNGDSFRVVRLDDGEGYFDWKGRVAKSGVKEGDTVKLEVTQAKYPRIRRIERVDKGNSDVVAQADHEANGRDVLITRMSCLRSATRLLAGSDEPVEAKRDKALALAEEMVAWVNNGHGEKA